jgi:hypothetical protein
MPSLFDCGYEKHQMNPFSVQCWDVMRMENDTIIFSSVNDCKGSL